MKIRQTKDGLRAVYDCSARLWRYYRWERGSYVETGSTRKYEDS